MEYPLGGERISQYRLRLLRPIALGQIIPSAPRRLERPFPLAWALGIIVGFCGCGEVTGLPSAEPMPVLQGILVAGEPRQILRAEWSSPTHVPYEPDGLPIDASLADLWLVAPSGDSVRYAPTGSPGELAAIAEVISGERYRLSGAIAAHLITAQVEIPGPLVVYQPGADTLFLTGSFAETPFTWRAESAAAYQALVVHDDGTTTTAFIRRPGDSSGSILDIAPDTTGQLVIFAPFPEEPDTARLVIFGYDPTTTAFFSSTTKGNIQGAFGLFGAAAKAEKAIVWE
jgi:hypothetical protein